MRRRVACSHGSCHSVWPSPLQRQRNGGLVADVPEALPRGRRSERPVSERPRLSATGSTRRTRRTRLAHAACARQPASHASPSRGRWSTNGPGELSQVRRAMRRAARTCVRAARASGGRAKPNILSTFVFGSPAGTAAAVRRHSRGHTRTRPARKNEHAGAQPPAYMTLFSPVPPKPSAPPRPRVPPKVPGGGCTRAACGPDQCRAQRQTSPPRAQSTTPEGQPARHRTYHLVVLTLLRKHPHLLQHPAPLCCSAPRPRPFVRSPTNLFVADALNRWRWS